MIVIAYYSNDGYRNMVYRLAGICDSWGIRFRAYNRAWLEKQPEYLPNRVIFDTPKGNGYWAWKPIIMIDALHLDNNVVYLDSSVVPRDVTALRNLVRDSNEITAINSSFINGDWTKPKCFEIMDCKDEGYKKDNHAWAGVVYANTEGQNILEEWRKFCLIPEAIADDPTFPNHRHDQSILTNLLLKYHKPLYVMNRFEDVLDYGGTYKRPQNFEEA